MYFKNPETLFASITISTNSKSYASSVEYFATLNELFLTIFFLTFLALRGKPQK